MTPDPTLTIAQLEAQGYTVTLTPPDPDEPYREAANAYRLARLTVAHAPDGDGDRIRIAGLRAAWPLMPETIEAILLLREIDNQCIVHDPLEKRIEAFLAKHQGTPQ